MEGKNAQSPVGQVEWLCLVLDQSRQAVNQPGEIVWCLHVQLPTFRAVDHYILAPWLRGLCGARRTTTALKEVPYCIIAPKAR